ncbi:MAG: ATP-binding protein [Blastocatellia bacterium]
MKGSGLGLTIVRHIVAAHRGRVAVSSEPGRGSAFAIHLPINPAVNPASQS